MKNLLFLLACFCTMTLSAANVPSRPFDLDYRVELLPKTDQARVSITIGAPAGLVSELKFGYDAKRFSAFAATAGTLTNVGGQVQWKPVGVGSTLSYLVKVSHARAGGSFDARMTADWALLRGDKIVPRLKVRMKKGATSRARLQFKLPPGWTGIETGWTRLHGDVFAIDSPERKFDRPVGWIIAGKIGVRRDKLGITDVAIAAPTGNLLDRMDALTLINFVWPEIENAFGKMPRKILIVGAGDPMWRGGLSAPNSLFLHSDRPLISENATSTLIHELVHVITRIRGKDRSDWIAEGLAEFYAIEIIYRAGGMSDERHDKVYAWMSNWSRGVKNLRGDSSTAQNTARAVLLLRDLDREIRKRSDDRRSLDDVTRALRPLRAVSTSEFIAAAEKVLGGPSPLLNTALLR